MNIFKSTLIAAAFLGFAASGVSAATTLPYGVLNDVSLSTVTGEWGWTQIYRNDYGAPGFGAGISYDTMFAGHGTYIMLGGIRDGSSTIDVLAATTWDAFNTYTAHNVTHESNGALWYNNGYSLGFAGVGDVINQTTADTNGQSERDRLSWHTISTQGFQNSALPAGAIWGGWRSGPNIWLNESTEWDMIVFTADALGPQPTPIPGALPLFASALGLGGFFSYRRKRKAGTT